MFIVTSIFCSQFVHLPTTNVQNARTQDLRRFLHSSITEWKSLWCRPCQIW